MRSILLLLAIVLPACAAAAEPPALHTKAVLIAADDSIVAFGNATTAMRAWLQRRGVKAGDIQLVGGRGPAATVEATLGAIRGIRAGLGDACLVYITGHGVARSGIYLRGSDNTLGRDELDRALADGCGERPTVVVLSSCFSGYYLDGRLPRGNRIIITAARRDRPSFGCGATDRFTFFDDCVLRALADETVAIWRAAQASAGACVVRREAQGGFVPSEPQISVGGEVAGMALPVRPKS
jgi:hypothetical protein